MVSFLPRKTAYYLATRLFISDLNKEIDSQDLLRDMSLFPQFSTYKSCIPSIIQDRNKMLIREELDTFCYNKMSINTINNYIKLSGVEHIRTLYRKKEQIIFYTGHYGRLMLPPVALGLMGFEVGCLSADPSEFDRIKGNYLRKKLKNLSLHMKAPLITVGKIRELYDCLLKRVGQVFVIGIDIPKPVESTNCLCIPFLGRKAWFPKGVLRIARKTGAKLVPYFADETSDGRVKGRIYSPLEIDGLSDYDALIQIFKPLEEKIKAHPENWWNWELFHKNSYV
jgi:phosphatidylinositol dimannoside acyltransferase